ncbi:MAG: hypothetical protein J6J60_06005 [Clostridia bacterium]|nr:hypothetical protein [Clostridia bacterium]
MINKAEVYNNINTKGYLRFELNESNGKEYLDKLISVQNALKDVEQKNQDAYNTKINVIENLKEQLKEFYSYIESVNIAEKNIIIDFDTYIENYIKPLNALRIRKEKLQLQVVPYITGGFVQKVKAIFSHEGRTKLAIEKQFNKELKSVSKEIKDAECLKEKNPIKFDNRYLDEEIKIISNLNLVEINQCQELTEEKISEFKKNIGVSKNVIIKSEKNKFLNTILDYIEVCNEYTLIEDLNVEEHYKFKNTEYKLYLQSSYLDNDVNSVVKYLETVKAEKDFVGKQAANKLIDGIQECINQLKEIIENSEELKLA